MIFWLFRMARILKRAISGCRDPRQLAWGLAFGVCIGLVPHGNLIAVLLLGLILCLKLNHALSALTAVATSFIAPLLDPITHAIGDRALSEPTLQSFARSGWDLPLIPWTELNNTVVLGSFILGLAALYPTYRMSHYFFQSVLKIESEETQQADERQESADQNETQSRHLLIKLYDERLADSFSSKITSGDQPQSFTTPLESAGKQHGEAKSELQHDNRTANETNARVDVVRLREAKVQGRIIPETKDDLETHEMDQDLQRLLQRLRAEAKRRAA